MATSADPSSTSYPPKLTPPQLSNLLTTFTDYALSHGLIVRPADSFISKNPNNSLATTAPVTLWPSPFPRAPFEEAISIQTACNDLYAQVASDIPFITSLISELAKVDEFMARLWSVHLDVTTKLGGYTQPLSLGLFRSDYMVHVEDGKSSIRQVEFNTIASSFGPLSNKVSNMHQYLYKVGAYPQNSLIKRGSLPTNSALKDLASGLATAHKAYVAQDRLAKEAEGRTAVVFIVQEAERNAFDQRWLEYSLMGDHDIRTYRLTLSEIPKLTAINSDGVLMLQPSHLPANTPVEISTIYFRAGYGPGDYPSDEEWTTRTTLERSRAIKCPTILTQLAGSKKVQQVLASKSELSRFIKDDSMCARVFDTFAGIFPLDSSPAGLEARELALKSPEKYVLKPQREGGGNNIYRSKIPPFLNSIPEDTWGGYILMELIEPPSIENIVVRNGETVEGGVVGELGVYGTVLWESDADGERVNVLSNEQAGWLLRTKGSASEEGGVAAGFGCVDSCVLVN